MSGMVAAGMAIGGAALSYASASSRNAAITAQANANAAATGEMLLQNRDVSYNNISQKARVLNEQIGMELTQLNFEAAGAGSKAVNSIASSGVTGASAARAERSIRMDAAMMQDNIKQKGESAMTDIQMEYSNAKYQYESGAFNNSIDYANTMNQRSTSMEIVSSMASSAMSFGAAGYGMMKK